MQLPSIYPSDITEEEVRELARQMAIAGRTVEDLDDIYLSILRNSLRQFEVDWFAHQQRILDKEAYGEDITPHALALVSLERLHSAVTSLISEAEDLATPLR